jgi:glycosyltransferase involved in cell wall biosynthesis
VLSYLCAGRAIVLAVPPENLASRIVDENRAGIVVPPTDIEGFFAAGMRLLNAPEEAAQMGKAARAYAEATFDVVAIADRFEQVFAEARKRR